MTPRLIQIYNEAKELSWSDKYLFAQDQEKVSNDEGLIRSHGLQRGLQQLCKIANVNYLPPHQVRFSDATIMILDGADITQVQSRLVHTTPDMANHYKRNVDSMIPAVGPNWTTKQKGKKKSSKH